MTITNNHNNFLRCKHCEALIGLLLVVATVAVYWQVANHDFINFDDPAYVSENPQVQKGLTVDSIVWSFSTTYAGNWHPLTWISHILDCTLYSLNPGGHHLTNLLFHTANTLLLLFVFTKMTGNAWRSGFVAALFALHPLHVESVAWVAERKDVLSTFFWMLTMLSYTRYVAQPEVIRYLPVLLFFALGLMAKPMLVTLPFVLLLLDYWPLGRIGFDSPAQDDTPPKAPIAWRLVWEKLPLFALAAISAAVTFYAQNRSGAVASIEAVSLGVRISNALISYVKYIAKTIYPAKLAVFYPHPGMLQLWQAAGTCLILLVISFAALRYIKTRRYLAVGWLWYVGTLIPVIGLVQIGSQSMADRYTYVPLIGLFVIVAWGAPELAGSRHHTRIWFLTLSAIILSILMPVTWKHVQYWKNSTTLFEHALTVTSNNYLAHDALGEALFDDNHLVEAIDHYLHALQINPDYENANYNLGIAFEKQGRVEDAIKYYLKSIQIDPYFAGAHYNLGIAFEKQGRIDDAIEHYRNALKIKPNHFQAHNNIGIALEKQGRIDDAIGHYQKALRIKPDHFKAHNNLGNLLLGLGRTDEAIEHYLAALRLQPVSEGTHNNLGIAFFRKGNIARAIDNLKEALRLKPDYADAKINLEKMLKYQRQRHKNKKSQSP